MELTTVQTLLGRQYAAIVASIYGNLTAIEQIVEEDFPAPDDTAHITRGDVDMLKDLDTQLAALVWGYERKI